MISEGATNRTSSPGLRTATLLKKRLWYRCFPVNFEKFLRTPFFTEGLPWLLLYEIITINHFCVYRKNTRKHNQHFKLLFFKNKFTLWHIRLNIYIWKINFTSHKQYLLVLSSREMQRIRLTQTKVYYKLVHYVWKETSHKPLKVAAAKES